jgi:hypothetical protein
VGFAGGKIAEGEIAQSSGKAFDLHHGSVTQKAQISGTGRHPEMRQWIER